MVPVKGLDNISKERNVGHQASIALISVETGNFTFIMGKIKAGQEALNAGQIKIKAALATE